VLQMALTVPWARVGAAYVALRISAAIDGMRRKPVLFMLPPGLCFVSDFNVDRSLFRAIGVFLV